MNWYKIAQGLVPYLQSLGVSPDILQFVQSLPKEQTQYYVNTIRRNPKILLEELQALESPQNQKIDPYLDQEKAAASSYAPNIQKWILVNLRKARQGRMDIPFNMLTAPNTPYPNYFHLIDNLRRWKNTQELTDFLRHNPQINIDSYTPDEINDMIYEWHAVSAGKGEGLLYGPRNPDLVVYGPKWRNEEWNGWTIQEVKTENDLKVEGNKQNNCVESYCREVESGSLRIFSLRNSNNEPKVTIETDPNIIYFIQILGNSNSEPENIYKTMLKEWIDSIEGDEYGDKYFGDEEGVLDVPYNSTVEDVNTRLDSSEMLDNYGLKSNFNINPDDFIMIIEWAQKESRNSRYGDYSGGITETSVLFVDAILKKLGPQGIEKLEKELYDYEENQDFYKNWDYEPYEASPDEEDFDTQEEYQVAFQEWEEKEQEAESEMMDEARSKWLPWGFIDDSFKYIHQLKTQGKIPKLQKGTVPV